MFNCLSENFSKISLLSGPEVGFYIGVVVRWSCGSSSETFGTGWERTFKTNKNHSLYAISYLCLIFFADLEMKKYTWNLRANSRWMQNSGIAQVRSRAGVARLVGNLALYLLPAGESPEVPRGSGFVFLNPKSLHHSLSQTSIEIFKKLSAYVRGLFLIQEYTRVFFSMSSKSDFNVHIQRE